jgi:transcriptional regulator with XRE-family HTH domain
MSRRPPVESASVEIDGNKLRTMRKMRGDTLEVFATKCGISFGFLSQVERGTRPNVGTIVFTRICDALDVDADQRMSMVRPAARRRALAFMGDAA